MKLDSIWTFASPFVKAVLILVAGRILIGYMVKLLGGVFDRAGLDQSLSRFLKKAIRIVAYVVVVMAALAAIGISTTGMIAALSGCAVAIGVALKDSLSNVAGGILLLVSPRFSTGDYIAAGGDEGTVVGVDLLHTTIRTADSKQVSIPNGVLVNSHITNYTTEQKRRVDISFPIALDADVQAAKAVALAVVQRHPLVLREQGDPFVRISGYSESAAKLLLRAWCATGDYWDLYYDLLEQVREALIASGIEIPHSQLDVHIRQ